MKKEKEQQSPTITVYRADRTVVDDVSKLIIPLGHRYYEVCHDFWKAKQLKEA